MANSNTYTDEELEKLEKKIKKAYKDAYAGMVAKCKDYFDTYTDRYDKEYQAYQQGKYTKAEFDAWVQAQVGRGKRWEKMRDDLASRITKTNQIATDYINGKTPSIFALNANYTAYEIEKASGVAFDIYNEDTVRNLISGNTNVTEFRTVRTNPKRDYSWNSDQIQRALTSSILQGNGIKELSNSFMGVMKRNNNAAIRNARTSFTSAQNAGRIETLKGAQAKGINVKKRWVSAHDGRVRDSHAHLDGQIRAVDKAFANGLQHPADSAGRPEEVYNCRCTLDYILQDIEIVQSNESWDEWNTRKKAEQQQKKVQKASKASNKPANSQAKYTYSEAKDLKEAESYARDTLNIEKVNYKGLDLDMANTINKSLTDALNYSEDVRSKVHFIGSAQEMNSGIRKSVKEAFEKDGMPPYMAKKYADKLAGRVQGDVLAFARNELDVNLNPWLVDYPSVMEEYRKWSGIGINKAFGKYETMAESTRRCERIKFHPESCSEPRSVVDHELGHILDYVYGVKDSAVIKSAFDDAIQEGITDVVSKYAGKNIREFIAECYSEYVNSKNPRKYAIIVGREIEKLKAGK